MKRSFLSAALILIMAVSLGAVAQAPRTDSQLLQDWCEDLVVQGYASGCVHLTTTTAPTTTTAAPTTTTAAPTTTTTVPPTTTTQPPTTTTTQPGIPNTIPHGGINVNNGYRIGVIDRSSGTGVGLWSANYHHELLYQSGTGWRNGDRIAYHCAYGFIVDGGQIVGRFTFRAVPTRDNNPDGAYIQINDTYMEDAPGSPQDTPGGPSRYYDGTQRPANIQTPFADCPQDVGVDYTNGTTDEDPIIPFWNDGQVIEIRDYRTVFPSAGVTFDELAPITTPFQITTSTGTHTVNDRRTVLARLNGFPVAVVYYDGLGTGSMFP